MIQGIGSTPNNLASAPSKGKTQDQISPSSQHMVRWGVVLCMTVFGPYIAGATTGQLTMLLWGAFIVLTSWPLAVAGRPLLVLVIGLWMTIFIVSIIAGTWRAIDPEFFGVQSAVHSMWWLIMPQLTIIISSHLTNRTSPELLLAAISRVIVIAMTINSVVALMQLSASRVNLGGILSLFWGATPAGVETVAQLSAENGRYIGVFNQPAEAGTAYGIALLCIIYLFRKGEKWQTANIYAILVVTGGILSISKVFIFVALPIAILIILGSSGIRLQVFSAAAISIVISLLAGSMGLLPTWGLGNAGFTSFLHPNGSLESLYTADRYGSGGGSMGPVAADVLHAAPLAGFGLGGLATPYDSLWLQILVISGFMGIIFMCVILVVLGWGWIKIRRVAAPAESMLAGSVLLLAALSSLGFPSLTAIRSGILIWLILGVFFSGCYTAEIPIRANDKR